MFVQWSEEKHSLNIPEIDRQHQEFFLITNQIFEAGQSQEERKNLIPVLKRLYAYTKYHFSSEEGIFRHYMYPHEEEHRRVHKEFTDRVKVYLQDFRDRPQLPVDEALDFLVNWILGHIQKEDRQYAEYFKERNIDLSVNFSSDKGSALKLWEEQKLSLDIHNIDQQHKELVFILQQFNDLQKATETRKRAFTPVFIKKLFFYAQYHFSFEEELLSKNQYKAIQSQKEQHKDFIMRIEDFVREYNLQKETLNDEIILFLKNWIVHHILEEDGKYKHFLQDKIKREASSAEVL